MTDAPTPSPVQASAPDIARRVGLILAGLAALVARRFLTEPRLKSLIVPLWTRLTRAATRFDRLMARVAADRLPKPRPARPRRDKPDATRPPALPGGHAWLIRAIPYEAAAYGNQLEALLAEPGVADLLAACPQAARILRPFGRMLGLAAFARKRAARKPRSRPASPVAASPVAAAPPRPSLPPSHPLAEYRPSAKWPRRPWPTGPRKNTHWPARPGRAAPA